MASQDAVTNGDANGTHAQPASDGLTSAKGISADEIALYDRQIRLWGVQAQERIRSANVLLVNVKAIGTEVAKNLILNGINSITILDNGIVTEDDLGAQYFVRDTDVGSTRAQAAASRLQELNPRVTVTANTSDPSLITPEMLHTFSIVIASDLPLLALSNINAASRMAGKPFYATGSHGFYGFIFADLINHEYIIEREQSNINTTIRAETSTRSVVAVASKKENGKNIELVTKRETYSPLLLVNSSPLPSEYLSSRRKLKFITPLLPCLRALWDFERATGRYPNATRDDLKEYTSMVNAKLNELQLPTELIKADFLRSFLQNVGSEIIPVAAFVGGRLAEDVINVLGKREQPIQNMLLFDGTECDAPIYALHPIIGQEALGLEAVPSVQGIQAVSGAAAPNSQDIVVL